MSDTLLQTTLDEVFVRFASQQTEQEQLQEEEAEQAQSRSHKLLSRLVARTNTTAQKEIL